VLRSFFLTPLEYAVLGPAIGGFRLVLYADVANLIQYHRVPASTGSWLGLVAVVYAAGVVPAAMTGVVRNLVLRRLSAAWRLSLGFRLVLGALTGAASCAAAGALVRAWEVTPSFFAQFCTWGAIAGAILAAIFPTNRELDASSKVRWGSPGA
jgi:hypothetical protein